MLEACGVEPLAETLYVAMLKSPGAGPAELMDRLGWSEELLTAVTEELDRLSLLRPSRENPHMMRPVAPELGLGALLARQQADLLRYQHRLEEGHAALQALVAELGPGAPEPTTIEQFVGLDAVREGLERLAYRTEFEVLAFAPDGAQTADSMAASRPLNRHLLDKGVSMRTVYLNSARNDPATTAHAEWLTDLGAELRTVPVLPLRMLIVDRASAVVPIDPANTATGACVVRCAGAVAAMSALFEQVWHTAAPWGVRRGPTDEPLTEQERALLQLLMQGDTDELAARRLGVSTRTVGRIAAELMTRLGARSRFQAGALAAARGWLAPQDTLPPALVERRAATAR